jgi:phosphatidylglycerol---prolipoprotein diacylglyceryl transferase
MHPTFDLGFTTLPAYFTLLMIAITTAVLVAHAEWIKKHVDGNFMLDLGLLMMVCGLLGSRILHVIADGHFMDYVNLCVDPAALESLKLAGSALCTSDQQCLNAGLGDLCLTDSGACGQSRDCLRILKIWYGGYVFYGGLLLCIPSAIWFIRRRDVPIWSVGDVAGFAIPFGQFVGRLGCFLAGCCFGATTDGPTGLSFPRYSPAWDTHIKQHLIDHAANGSLPVHPTQLYESLACLAICLFGVWRYRRGKHFRGELFFQYIALYAIFRFLVELVRADERGAWLDGLLTTSQLVSLPMLLWAGWVLVRRKAWPPDVLARSQPKPEP